MKELPITIEQPDNWMGKTGGYAKDMTLRDYFAAQWLQGAAADPSTREWRYNGQKHAETAYIVADAMLKSRN